MELNSKAGLFDCPPPRLDDAGLEDCALPTHALQEAFRLATNAVQSAQQHVGSAANSILGSIGTGEEFSKNRGPSSGPWEDSCVDPDGLAPLGGEKSCVDTRKGGLIEEGHDLVVVKGPGDFEGGNLVFGGEDGPKLGDDSCVEGIPGGGQEPQDSTSGDTEEGPILVLG